MVRQERHIYEFGPFRLIPEERQLLRDNQIVPLTPKSFDLLVVLVENNGHLINKGDLINRIWPDSFVEEANLSVKMSELRRALGEGPGENQFIETVPRRGYRFVASVKEGLDEGAESFTREIRERDNVNAPVADEEQKISPLSPAVTPLGRLSFRRWPFVLGGMLLISALLLGWNAGRLRERMFATANPVRIQSLAVLPLDNLSGDASQNYFAEGMTDALTTDLAKIGALRVISRQSVMQYSGTQKPLPEIGRELSVDAVLTGSVMRSGERVRIAVQLVHAATGRNLWADSYERDLLDVLTLQREVTRDIVGEVRIKLTPQEQVQFGSVGPVNPEAYDHYLRGKYYLHRQKRDDNETAVVALESSVAADPTFAAASWPRLMSGSCSYSPRTRKCWRKRLLWQRRKRSLWTQILPWLIWRAAACYGRPPIISLTKRQYGNIAGRLS